jgi:hypothetical protein
VKINWKNIKDWVQIIGTLAAIIGLIWSIYHSNKNDSVLQAQINHLDTISEQSRLQTEKLQKQVEILREEKEFLYKQFEIQTKRRELEIKPKLSISLIRYDGQHVFEKLINNGSKAEIIEIILGKDNNMKIEVPFKAIGRGKGREIYFKPQNEENPVIDFKIIFEDIEGTRDTASFNRRGRKNVFVRDPTPTTGLIFL